MHLNAAICCPLHSMECYTPSKEGVGGDSFPSQMNAVFCHNEEWGGTPSLRTIMLYSPQSGVAGASPPHQNRAITRLTVYRAPQFFRSLSSTTSKLVHHFLWLGWGVIKKCCPTYRFLKGGKTRFGDGFFPSARVVCSIHANAMICRPLDSTGLNQRDPKVRVFGSRVQGLRFHNL